MRSEEHKSELQSQSNLVCRLLLEKKKKKNNDNASCKYIYYSLVSLFIYRPLSTPLFFFFNDTATTEIYTLSLHDALPISICRVPTGQDVWKPPARRWRCAVALSTRVLMRQARILTSPPGP